MSVIILWLVINNNKKIEIRKQYLHIFYINHFLKMNDIPDIWELMNNICCNQQFALNWIFEQGVFYNIATGTGVIFCKNG